MEKITKAIDNLIERRPELAACREEIAKAAEIIVEAYEKGGKLIICGNGGSAADAEHMVGELMKGFAKKRPLIEDVAAAIKAAVPDYLDAEHLAGGLQQPLSAISLVAGVSLPTAFANDQAADLVFAQQLYGLAQLNDVFIAISTSGNSPNVLYAAAVAKALGVKTVALTGASGGKLKGLADAAITAPAEETYLIQELHLPIYHALCLAVEEYFFDK